MGSQVQASKPPSHCNMKPLIIFGLVALVRTQYSGETQDLSNSQLDALKDIFGDAAGNGAYSGQQAGRLEGGTNGVEAIIQVVKNEDGYVAPDDYQQTQGALTDKATSNVDNVFENCADYTESQGYECVPYYQCHNGTIITDGGGLIDIRNGFGILSPEDSTCPSVARGTRTDSELGSRASTSTSPSLGNGLTCVQSSLRNPLLRIRAMLENLRP